MKNENKNMVLHEGESSFGLPYGWVWVKVKEIGEIITGTTPPKSRKEYYGKEYPFYKPTDLNDGYYIKTSEDGLSRKGIEKARLLPEKSILVTCIGATIGKTGLIRKEGASNQQINAIIPNALVVPEFVYFICMSPQFQKSIIDNASSTTLLILNKSKFESLYFPLPPLNEQKRIVEKIEELFTRLEAGVEALKKVKAQIKRYRQAVLKYAFEGKLTEDWRKSLRGNETSDEILKDEILRYARNDKGTAALTDLPPLPEGWRWVRLGEIFEVETGSTPRTNIKEYWNGDIKWITPKDLGRLDSIYINDTERKITAKGLANCSATMIPAKSIVVSTRAPIGYIAIVADDMAFNQGCKGLVPKNKDYYFEKFYYYLLLTKVDEMNSFGSGSTFKEISKPKLENIFIPLPPLPEQHQIVSEIERRFSVADEVEKIVEQSLKQAERLRQSILKRAFEGKLVQ